MSENEERTQASLGIDTVSILEIVAKYVGRTSSAYRYISEDLKQIGSSHSCVSDPPIGFMYRVHLKGCKDGVHWSEVTKEEFDKLETYEGEAYWVERAILNDLPTINGAGN